MSYGHHHHQHGGPGRHPPPPPSREEESGVGYSADGPDIKGDVVKLFCETDKGFNLSVVDGEVVMAQANDSDPYQQWIKDESWGTKAKDSSGLPAFALINKGSGKALYHGSKAEERIRVDTYYERSLNEVVLWTCSEDVGNGWHAIRPISNIKLNLDVDHGTRCRGGLHDGQAILLFTWNDQENQHWRIEPISNNSY